MAVDVLGLTIMIPLLPFYAERLGASPTQVGWLVGVYALCQLFSGPILGRLSDHTGRKPLLIVSQIGTLIGFLITAWAPLLWLVFLGRIIDGATAGNLSLAQAYISDVTKPEDRAKSFGVIGIAFGFTLSKMIAWQAGWSTVVTTSSIVVAFGVSVFIGLLFGIYPAVQAAKLDPIEAIRYE